MHLSQLFLFISIHVLWVDAFTKGPFVQNPISSYSIQTAPLSAISANGYGPIRNIFHDYDKPIILLGSSGPAKELETLAKFFLSQQLGESDDGHTDRIIRVASKQDDNVDLVTAEALIEAISSRTYQWPNVILLDFQDPVSSDPKVESHFMSVARALYENDLLSIYVNVDGESSNMSPEVKEKKKALEDTVFLDFSDYELCIKDEGKDVESTPWRHIEWELLRLLARARLIPAIPGDKERSVNTAHLTMGKHTFFLSLSFPDIAHVEPYVEQMCQDVDAMEYRTDLLDCRDSSFDLIYGMQLLRRYCRPHTTRVPALPFGGTVIENVIPIVYTVRTKNQAGTYPDDDEGIASMFKLLGWGLRAGVEVLDVESAWNMEKTADLLDLAELRYSSQILGSHHVVGKEISTEEAVMLFQQCALGGRAHGAKVVLSINDEENDRMAYEAALIASELAASAGDPIIPHISLILGDVGQFSRVINLPFTPVTHESLPFKAAPGQMTSNEIMMTRLLTKIFTPKKFAILGHNIAYSVSPQMHGAAFSATKLPHEYLRVDVATVEEFVESALFNSDDFGGTSVTIPHKQAIIPYVDVLSEAAKEIGSVNTIIVKEEFEEEGFRRVVYGDNTDWRGIYNPLNRLLGNSVDSAKDYALILGAGGTGRAAAYVASKLGLQLVYYNRTPSKAAELAEAFGGSVVESLDESGQPSLGGLLSKTEGSRVRVVISTLPAASKFTLPNWIVTLSAKPIIFDVNYKPFYTELLKQAENFGCKIVRGSEMLWEQGVGQFELWTERSAPYSVMKSVVLENCDV